MGGEERPDAGGRSFPPSFLAVLAAAGKQPLEESTDRMPETNRQAASRRLQNPRLIVPSRTKSLLC
jgi:hypothetical protein